MIDQEKLFRYGALTLLLVVIFTFVIWQEQKNREQEGLSEPQPILSSPASFINSSNFRGVVKEITPVLLLVSTTDEQDAEQLIEIPLDANITFEAWAYEGGKKNKPPKLQSASAADLQAGQTVDVLKTETGVQASVYSVTIHED